MDRDRGQPSETDVDGGDVMDMAGQEVPLFAPLHLGRSRINHSSYEYMNSAPIT